jgi:hypothetical protein
MHSSRSHNTHGPVETVNADEGGERVPLEGHTGI